MWFLGDTSSSDDECRASDYRPKCIEPARETLDVLGFTSFMNPIEPIGSYTVRVIDRGTLLGSQTVAFDPSRSVSSFFKAPTSIFTFRNPTIIDFTSFKDGTFDGVIEFTINSGVGNGGRVSEGVVLGRTIDASTFINSPFVYPDQHASFDVVPASAPVPEPGSLLLLGTGAVGLLARAGRRARQRLRSAAPPHQHG